MSKKVKMLVASVIGVTLLILVGTGVAYASDGSRPGDILYPIDKASESIQRALITDATNKTEFELDVMDERVKELNELSTESDDESIKEAISEVDDQQVRLQTRLQEMTQLREENKIQTQEQLKVMEKLQTKVQEHEGILNQVQTKLKSSEGDSNSTNSENLTQVQSQYMQEALTEVQEFEDATGVEVKESETQQNQGDDSEIQNQNQNNTQQQGGDSKQNSGAK